LFIVEHDLKSLVGLGFAVHFKARAIKAPEKIGLFEEEIGVGTIVKVEQSFVWRIVVPETFVASEVW
jgi:hypothetical protein